jgi:uncharacterized integral membrane protein
MRRFTFPLVLIVLAVAALLFSGLNHESVDVEFAFTDVRISLGLALIISCVFGLLVGILIRGAWVAELLSERGRLRRALKAAEAKARTAALVPEETSSDIPADKNAG